MTDAEIDELYALLASAPVDVWGTDSRNLTAEEQSRYEQWTESMKWKCLYRVTH